MHHSFKHAFQICLVFSLIGIACSTSSAQSNIEAKEASTTQGHPQSGAIVVTGKRRVDCQSLPLSSENREEVVLEGMDIIDVKIRGHDVRLEVDPGADGPIILNAKTVERLGLQGKMDLTYQFGAFDLRASTSWPSVDFGCKGKRKRRVAWTGLAASEKADGVIGVHDLPYKRVTFKLGKPSPSERVEQFELKLAGGRRYPRVWAEIDIGGKDMLVYFSLDIGPNLVSASTANFLATHQEGGFVADSDGVVKMMFDLPRPTRDMQLAYPIEFAGLKLKQFAVRYEDFGRPSKVGEIEQDDPRFEPGHILVSRRKGHGRPDLITRIGRDQFAHCSQLTFDMDDKVGFLTCPVHNDEIDR